MDRSLFAWLVAVVTWVVGDTESTMLALDEEGLGEVNPLMRPFVRRGRPGIYAAKAVTFVVLYRWSGGEEEAGWNLAGVGVALTSNNCFQWIRSRLLGR